MAKKFSDPKPARKNSVKKSEKRESPAREFKKSAPKSDFKRADKPEKSAKSPFSKGKVEREKPERKTGSKSSFEKADYDNKPKEKGAFDKYKKEKVPFERKVKEKPSYSRKSTANDFYSENPKSNLTNYTKERDAGLADKKPRRVKEEIKLLPKSFKKKIETIEEVGNKPDYKSSASREKSDSARSSDFVPKNTRAKSVYKSKAKEEEKPISRRKSDSEFDTDFKKRSFSKNKEGEYADDKPKRVYKTRSDDDAGTEIKKKSYLENKENKVPTSDYKKRSFSKNKEFRASDEGKLKAFNKAKAGADGDKEVKRVPYNRGKASAESATDPKRKPYSRGKDEAIEIPYTKSYAKKEYGERKEYSADRPNTSTPRKVKSDGMRLNKFLSNAGIASRRKADQLIEAGEVMVNDEIITTLGHMIKPEDKVRFNGQLLKSEKLVYVIMNKPKDYITTTDDPQERRTVMDLVKTTTRERIYPVGRLDRNTTGLLLLTNDGDLAMKLSHPKNLISKIYQVKLDKNLRKVDLESLMEGVELEDGLVKPDAVSYIGESKTEIGVEIHSGKNRIVRRMFEHFGYEVIGLDRVFYAGLTKKDLPRGRCRLLTEQEVINLKHLHRK